MLILIKSAGDIATGVAVRLKNCGFDVVMLETNFPTTVRRTVAFSTAVFDEEMEVEGIKAKLVNTPKNVEYIRKVINNGEIPVVIDENGESIENLKPDVVVDAIIAKKNIATNIKQAKKVIALGPGFNAGVDCHYVIETNRGHNLGRVIKSGYAEKNTGVPGVIDGYSKERVLRATEDGIIENYMNIGDIVSKNDKIARINDIFVTSEIEGMIRGLIKDKAYVKKGMKIGDIDPRAEYACYNTVSDKARAIAGGVLEAVLTTD